MQVLLEIYGSRAKVTEDLLSIAVGNNLAMLKLLLGHGKHKVKITEALIKAAAKSYRGDETLKYLLERDSNKEAKITEDILVAAGENHDSPKLMKILLEERGKDITLTERVLQAVLKSSNGGSALEVILGQRDAVVEITDRVLLSAIDHSADRIPTALQYNWEAIDVMKVLLKQSHKKIQVTEEVAEVAARKLPRDQEMRSVLQMRGAGAQGNRDAGKGCSRESTLCQSHGPAASPPKECPSQYHRGYSEGCHKQHKQRATGIRVDAPGVR